MVRWGEQTFEEMMIGYLDMDVPVGEPVLHGPDFQPTTEKATWRRSRRCGGLSAATGRKVQTRADAGQAE